MTGLGWGAIVRLGAVQSAIGAMVMLATSLLNRVMVVEYGLVAALPAGLVAWHYAVQLTRPLWGHGSDSGRRRTPWIIAGLAVLGAGTLLSVSAIPWFTTLPVAGYAAAILGFTMIGAGVGAAGTSLLALLASATAPGRRPAAAAITWIMMVMGIVVTAGTAGSLLEPFSFQRLQMVTGGVIAAAFLVATLALWGVERRAGRVAAEGASHPPVALATALRELWADAPARQFTAFVFLSMLAYSMQDMILEPFAGLVFGMTPGESTKLSGMQHGGVLIGMIAVGVGGAAFGGRSAAGLRRWIFGGCVASALALAGLALAASRGAGWPLSANVALLGVANGVFAVSAIGTMMALAGAGGAGREGVRMGVWGAAQAIAFGLGGLIGAVAADVGRAVLGSDGPAFTMVFAGEALLFLAAAWLALGIARAAPAPREWAVAR